MPRGDAPAPDTADTRDCWRCQAAPPANEFGVCAVCLADLRERQRRDGPRRHPLTAGTPAAPPPPPGPALGHAATAAALARYRRRALTVLAAGIALLVGFAVAANVVEMRAASLALTGTSAPGVVEAVQGSRMVVSFQADGDARLATIHLDSRSPTYRAGEPVEVIYDPEDPDRVRTPTETNQSPLTAVPMSLALPLGCLLIAVGTIARVRAARMRRVLTRQPWQAWHYRYRDPAGRNTWPVLAIYGHPASDRSGPLVLEFPWTPVWRLRLWRHHPRGTVWLAGDSARLMVAARPDLQQLFVARSRRSTRRRRLWPQPSPPSPAPTRDGQETPTTLDADTDPALVLDITPDRCWRCDTAPAANSLGTCPACLTDLRTER